MSESNLYKSFKKNWKSYLQRIEPANIGDGFPDCHLVNENKNDIFLELKFLPKKFINKSLPIRNSQVKWFLNYKGRFAFVLFKIDKSFYLFDKSKIFIISRKILWSSFEQEALLKRMDMQSIVKYLNSL
ncbi:MAG: hypothetical protein ACJASR_000145 [Psychroserpens sp.]|jgi:hypothetical protein